MYIYVVEYDLGFAPNPFHGACTLSCCKPMIRRKASVGDWIVGVGGGALKATGRCIYAMQVTDTMTFDEYWNARRFRSKRPSRNGSRVSMVGDNIYWRDPATGDWNQEDSVHSGPEGEPDPLNTAHDTQTDRTLISDRFVYFGNNAPLVPMEMLTALPYRNGRGYRVYTRERGEELLGWIHEQAGRGESRILGDPYQLRYADRRFSLRQNRLV